MKKNLPCKDCKIYIWNLKNSSGYCKTCWWRNRKDFKVKDSTRQKMSRYRTDNPTYHTIHNRIYKLWGQPKECENCGLKDILKRYEWANIRGNYILERNEWLRLCVSCHRSLDYKNPKTLDWRSL